METAQEIVTNDQVTYAKVEVTRTGHYAHIEVSVTTPLTFCLNNAVVSLRAQIGTDERHSEREDAPFMTPYAIRAAIKSYDGVELAAADMGVKQLRAFNNLVNKYESVTMQRAPFAIQAKMLMQACGCKKLLYRSDYGWTTSYDALAELSAANSGTHIKRVLDDMVEKIAQHAKTRR